MLKYREHYLEGLLGFVVGEQQYYRNCFFLFDGRFLQTNNRISNGVSCVPVRLILEFFKEFGAFKWACMYNVYITVGVSLFIFLPDIKSSVNVLRLSSPESRRQMAFKSDVRLKDMTAEYENVCNHFNLGQFSCNRRHHCPLWAQMYTSRSHVCEKKKRTQSGSLPLPFASRHSSSNILFVFE